MGVSSMWAFIAQDLVIPENHLQIAAHAEELSVPLVLFDGSLNSPFYSVVVVVIVKTE